MIPDTTSSGRSRSDVVVWAVIAALVLARIVAIVILLRSGVEHEGTILGGDARRYLEILHTPGTPYRDHAVEYTPLTLGFLSLVDRVGVHATLTAIAWSQLALELAVVAVLWRVWSRRTALWYLVLGTPLLLFPFPYARVDLLTVLLAVSGVALVVRHRPVIGGATIGMAVLAKVWPWALAPLLLVRRQRRGIVAFATTVSAGTIAWIAWAGTAGIAQVVSFRNARGWQIESLPGIVAHAFDPGSSVFESGAWRSGAPMTWWGRVALFVASLASVAWAWWRADRADATSRDDAEAVAATFAVVALLVLAPILSTQYVLWLLPFAAIVAARGDRATGALALIAAAMSTAGLAWIHQLTDGDRWAIAIVAIRDVVLVVLGVHLARRLQRAGAAPTTQPARTS